MLPLIPSLLFLFLLASPALLTSTTSTELQVRGERTPRNAEQDSIKVVISEGCATQEDSSGVSQGKEIDLAPGSPLVLTHKIKLVPSGSGSGSCGCEGDFAALRERLERLEKEVSELREKCGGADGSCCTSESKGAGCTIKPETAECPNECSDQGRCKDGKCVCFPGHSGPDCSESNCPGNCNDKGRCVNGQCACDPGFSGPDCSQVTCPDNCNNRGRCVNGRCVCDSGFTGPSCSDESCPGNCNNRGRCVNGQCVCNPGFTDPDCSRKACPDNCNNRGRCVNGKCVCDSGFTGADCSEPACPGNCNNRGRCVNGQCICDDGFTGQDCSEKTCPNDCNNRGRCVNGKCVCDSGFTGKDCSENSCPDNCSNRGRCVNGQCVCDEGFTGANCFQKACPNNCSNRGNCVNGKCVCEVGFTGPDCAAKGCPNNCSNKGRCIKGRCVCRRGFTGEDCSQCQEGMTGPNCDMAMLGVSQLRTRDITETSATLVWTLPSVLYEMYEITFTSKKKSDQQISVQVDGSMTTFTQTGLAAGQEYTATIVGLIDGRRGAESSTEFMTLISGPKNLQVVKTTTTSAVVQWEESQGEIERYRLTITPNDGAGRSQEMTIEAGKNSAHIQQLEAGRLYDIILVAEKGTRQSQPSTTQAVPGKTFPGASTKALTMQVTQAPGQDAGSLNQDLNPSSDVQTLDQQGGGEAKPARGRGYDDPDRGSSVTGTARTKPSVGKMLARNGTRVFRQPILSRPKVPGSFRVNESGVLFGGKRFVAGPLKKDTAVVTNDEKKKLKPDVLNIGDSVRDLNVNDSSFERRDDKPAAVIPETDSETNRQQSSREPTAGVGSKRQPDVGIGEHGNDTHPVSSEPTGIVQSQNKKCMNRIKVTHFRFPLKDRGNGCKEGGAELEGNTLSLDPSDTPPNGETGLDFKTDPLHKLITDTFDNSNITTISVHLSKPSTILGDAEAVRRHILGGLKPLSSFSSSSLSLLTSQSSSQPSTSDSPSSTASKQTSILTYLVSSSALSLPSPSSSPPSSVRALPSSSSDESDSLGSNELDVDKTETVIDSGSPENSEVPPSGASDQHHLRPTPPKHVHIHHLQLNKTHSDLNRPAKHFRHIPRSKNETRLLSTGELSLSPSSSASDELSSLQHAPVKETSREEDIISTDASSGENQKKVTGKRIPVRRPPPKGGFQRRPYPNRSDPSLTHSSKPSTSEAGTQRGQVFPSELPVSKDSLLSGSVPVINGKGGGNRTRITPTSLSSEFNQTTRDGGVTFSRRPHFRRPQPYGGFFHNKTRTNVRLPPQRGPMHKPSTTGKLNAGSRFPTGSRNNQLEKASTTDNTETQSGQYNVHRSTHRSQINQSGKELHQMAKLNQSAQTDGHTMNGNAKNNELGKGDDILIQTEETSDSDIHKERIDIGRNTGTRDRDTPSIKSDSKASRPVIAAKRQPPLRTVTTQHPRIHGVGESQKGEHIITNPAEKRGFDTETDQAKDAATNVTSGALREPLDFVGVTNRTSDGFTVVWDSPDGKYKSFVVNVTEAENKERPRQEKSKQEQDEDQRTKRPKLEIQGPEDDNTVSESSVTQVPKIQSSTDVKPTMTDKTFKKVLPGSARSFQFEGLPPQTEYTLTLLGKGPGLLSRLHKLVISTGPEPPTNIVFSKVTESSLTVSWTKPKSPVSGFKVTYTHADDGEPVLVTVDSEDSSLNLPRLSPGSTYEVTIISTLRLDESDPIKDFVMTLPDPPTDLRAINVTDTTALLLWRPALAAIDKYTIVYGSGTGSEMRITVSGNAAEQQLSGLEGSTTYTVTITSQLDNLESSPATTSFTTTSGSRDDGPRDLQASNVTPRTAMLSWKPPSQPVGSYILTYQTEGQEIKEVIVDGTLTQYSLSRLHPGSLYTVQLQAGGKGGGRYISTISTEFTTGTLRFPFPTDCTQELLNGIHTSGVVEIFPQGKLGASMMVYCDMETDGGGWMVFQRRKDGSVDFFRGWKDYLNGFGDLNGEFWFGLEKLHNLTGMTKMMLRVDLGDQGETVFAKYSTFEVAKRNYKLTVGGYSGTAGDSLSYHNNRLFSTKDRDPTPFITRCAMSYRGGWWYKNCHEANLNGLYGIDVKHQGVIWTSWKGKEHSIQFTEMKMRPAAFRPPTTG